MKKSTMPQGKKRNEHVVPHLEAMLISTQRTPLTLDEAFLSQAVRHLASCAECRASLATLEVLTSDPLLSAALLASEDEAALRALLEHAEGKEPDAMFLARYAARVASVGSARARSHFTDHDAIAHITACPLCQEAIEQGAMALAEAQDLIEAPAVPDSHAAPIPLWQICADGTRQLIAAFRVTVARFAVSISNPLADLQARVELVGTPRVLDLLDLHQDYVQQIEHFTIDLHEDSQPRAPWVRLDVRLEATHSRMLSFRLQTTYLADEAYPAASEPASGLPWRLMRVDDRSEATWRQGQTDARGIDGTYLEPEEFGNYLLGIAYHGQWWEIPLQINRRSD